MTVNSTRQLPHAPKTDAIRSLNAGKAFKMQTSFRAAPRGKSPSGRRHGGAHELPSTPGNCTGRPLPSTSSSRSTAPAHAPGRRRRRRPVRTTCRSAAGDAQASLCTCSGTSGFASCSSVPSGLRLALRDPFSRSGYSAFPDEADDDARGMLGLRPGEHAVLRRRSGQGPRPARQKWRRSTTPIESGIHCAPPGGRFVEVSDAATDELVVFAQNPA